MIYLEVMLTSMGFFFNGGSSGLWLQFSMGF